MMESTLKRIFEGKKENDIHSEFVKFSRGNFENKYLIDAKKQADKYSIKTGAEFANFLVKACLGRVQNTNIKVTGVIVSTFNIRDAMGGYVFNPEEEVKQFMGIKQLKVDGEISSSKITEVIDKFPKAFYALSFSGADFALKIKAKAPKSAKPSTKGENEVKADFCSLKTNDRNIINDLFFDYLDFKEISVNHTIQINEIILPKGETDPVKIRENAIRKGKIIRRIRADGRKIVKECEFEV